MANKVGAKKNDIASKMNKSYQGRLPKTKIAKGAGKESSEMGVHRGKGMRLHAKVNQ